MTESREVGRRFSRPALVIDLDRAMLRNGQRVDQHERQSGPRIASTSG